MMELEQRVSNCCKLISECFTLNLVYDGVSVATNSTGRLYLMTIHVIQDVKYFTYFHMGNQLTVFDTTREFTTEVAMDATAKAAIEVATMIPPSDVEIPMTVYQLQKHKKQRTHTLIKLTDPEKSDQLPVDHETLNEQHQQIVAAIEKNGGLFTELPTFKPRVIDFNGKKLFFYKIVSIHKNMVNTCDFYTEKLLPNDVMAVMENYGIPYDDGSIIDQSVIEELITGLKNSHGLKILPMEHVANEVHDETVTDLADIVEQTLVKHK